MTTRWGIAGTGRIADVVAEDFAHVSDGELVAIGSRDADRAAEFGARHGGARGLTYRQLIDDPEVDAIYLGTPHPQHRDLALAAIAAGKAVLVEKAFTATVAGAEQVVDAARQAGVFCMEAMWTRFQPATVKARELIADGAIGEVRQVQADLGAYRAYDPSDRLFDPKLGGGAALDLGVYVLSIAQQFLGTPDKVTAHGELAPNGVDMSFGALLGYADGRVGVVTAGFDVASPGRAVVMGSDGSIELMPRFHHPTRLRVTPRQGDAYELELPASGRGYAHEFNAVDEYLAQGLTESPVMPLDDTLDVQRMLGQVTDQLGVQYEEGTVEV
ncbi:Gfo/Idh/MocA family protein [Enemella evansiae]|uniref:Gfo/Idh/MocA family protein n=1 Tax=Enemella evansiae TaxID=2016499 RepID=UPI000B97B067|nr:Gfo/Idh/MocA family oxidoreductase [Enemella evansiae]OYO02002.1 oxidoreductase [Enemella evansiae]